MAIFHKFLVANYFNHPIESEWNPVWPMLGGGNTKQQIIVEFVKQSPVGLASFMVKFVDYQ
jgi:hypothetical protein